MKHQPLNLIVHAEIMAVPGLTLSERVALARIADYPGYSNAGLAHILGISVRGAEAMMRRLRERGLIQQHGEGRARAHRLTFPVSDHTECGNFVAAKSHNPCGAVAPSLRSDKDLNVPDFIKLHSDEADFFLRHIAYMDAAEEYRIIRERIEAEPVVDEAGKAKLINYYLTLENRMVVLHYGLQLVRAKRLPCPQQTQLALMIYKASPDQLGELRTMLDEGAALGGALDVLALPAPSA